MADKTALTAYHFIPLLHRHGLQQNHPQHTNAPLQMCPLSAATASKRFTNRTAYSPMNPRVSTAHHAMQRDLAHRPRSVSAWSIQPPPPSPQLAWQPQDRSFCRRIRRHDVHCRQLEPWQHRRSGAMTLVAWSTLVAIADCGHVSRQPAHQYVAHILMHGCV